MRILEQLGFGPKRFHTKKNGGWLVEVEPPDHTGFAKSELFLTESQFERYSRWLEGDGLIQDVLPDLSQAQREILISGIKDEEFVTFKDDE